MIMEVYDNCMIISNIDDFRYTLSKEKDYFNFYIHQFQDELMPGSDLFMRSEEVLNNKNIPEEVIEKAKELWWI